MVTRSHYRGIRPLLVLVLLCLLAVGNTTGHVAARARDVGPKLVDVTTLAKTPTAFTIVGMDFTPRGRVYLAIYDEMGATLFETRWVTASSDPLHGPGDSLPTYHDPGGVVHESFSQLCGVVAMMRALDEETEAWSNWLPVRVGCAGDDPNRRPS